MTGSTAGTGALISQPLGGCIHACIKKNVLDQMGQGLCVYDQERRVILFNNRYVELLGLPPEKVCQGTAGEHLVDLSMAAGHVTQMTRAELLEVLWSNLPAGGCLHRAIVLGGRTFSVNRSMTPDGYWVVTLEDITDLVGAKQAPGGNDAQLRSILETIPDCVQIFNAKGERLYVNSRGLVLFGAEDEEDLSRPGYSPIPPEAQQTYDDLHEKVISGQTLVARFPIVKLSGDTCDVEAHATAITLPDGSTGRLCIARNITEREKANQEIRKSEERVRLVLEATGMAVFESGRDGTAIISDEFREQCGLPDDCSRLPFDQWIEMVHPDDRETLLSIIQSSLNSEESFHCEFRIIRADTGEVRWISSYSKSEIDEEGIAIRSIGAHLDITERKRAEHALKENETRYRFAAEASGMGVWDYDSTEEKQEVSDRFRIIFGFSNQTSVNLDTIVQSVQPAYRGAFLKQLMEIKGGNTPFNFDNLVPIHRARDQAERWLAVSASKGPHGQSGQDKGGKIIITVRDVTEERSARERIRWSASHDSLTGLANRNQFQIALEASIEQASATHNLVGVIVLDLDHFKLINDTLGHDAGDDLLRTLSERLRQSVREGDLVARLGGDEFAIIIPCLGNVGDLAAISASIQKKLGDPFVYDGQLLDCSVSAGACAYPSDGRTRDELLKSADIALYAAKAAGRAQTVFFRPELKTEVQARTRMVNQAREAIQRQRIVPYYQPKLDLASGSVTGFEALLRWRNVKGKTMLPTNIEAAFENLDVASAMSDCMIESLISDVSSWLDKGIEFGHVALNAAAAEFHKRDFAERFLEQIYKADLPAQCFQLEVTESVFLGRAADYVQRALSLLSANGIKIALDDFGTGYASLRHLKEFPVDIIKIDRSFVRDMNRDQDDEAIVRAVVDLGRNLGLEVVAEGVEAWVQAKSLVRMGCTTGQGFLFSKAIPASRVAGYLARDRAWPELEVPEATERVRLRLVGS